jgi:UDP-N-acetylmuramoyl-tripeptide--D-alanyl-D-alanine ligase
MAEPGPRGASVDSRRAVRGELFVGLRGDHLDGGEYADRALDAGAWGVLVTPEHAEVIAGARRDAHLSGDDYGRGAVLAHPDPLEGLQGLARAWRRELRTGGTKVVAITGSTGKTSTKDILAALLASQARVVASPENFNTEIGLPLAVLGAPGDTEVLVLEMAMRGAGQIALLCAIAEPDVGLILNVGPAHLEQLGSVQAIAAAKAELITGLASDADATLVVPAREPLLRPHLRAALHTVTFGVGGDVELQQWRAGEALIADGPLRMSLRPSFSQRHNLSNLLAAVATARALGITPGGEVRVHFSGLRGERHLLPGGAVLIDDCYNANPMSVRAAIDDLADSAPGRSVAVLGDMLELGPEARRFHREIGRHAAARGVELLVTVGPLAAAMREAFDGESHTAPDAAAAVELLRPLLREGDTVLVKGSRGVGLERVARALGGEGESARSHDEGLAPSAGPGRR